MNTSSNLAYAKGIIIAVALIVLLFSYATIFVLPEEAVIRITKEDNIIEYSTAIFYLLAFVLAFVLFFSVRKGNDFGFFRTSRNLFFMVLGIIFFLVFGEEISWGQRIFGWTTPAFLEKINWKGETNIHNVDIIMTVSMTRLFGAGCVVYAILVPVLNFTSQKVARFVKRINVPVVSLPMAALFLINFILPRVINAYSLIDDHCVNEIKEFNMGLLFLGVTGWFLCSPNTGKQ